MCRKVHTGATSRQWRLPSKAAYFPDEPPMEWERLCGECRTRLLLALGCGCAYCVVVAEWLGQGWEVTT